MTVGARNRTLVGGLIVAVAALVVLLLPLLASPASRIGDRDIRLVVRNMTFYIEGQNNPNPMITLRAGEQVRITLRSEDVGMGHDFAVKAWGVAGQLLKDRGTEEVIVFRVPLEKGEALYHCTLHSAMMRGVLKVE